MLYNVVLVNGIANQLSSRSPAFHLEDDKSQDYGQPSTEKGVPNQRQ